MDGGKKKSVEQAAKIAAYGTLGPSSDCGTKDAERAAGNARALKMLAVILGVGAALAVSAMGGAGALWGKIGGTTTIRTSSRQTHSKSGAAVASKADWAGRGAQEQAEILLERAVGRSDGAAEQIAARVEGWRGKLTWDAQMSQLTTAALNSTDVRVRESGVEVQLAAYGLSKSDGTVDGLVGQANSRDHSQKAWALWSLGLLGNRGIETERVVEVLSGELSSKQMEASEEDRRWAVEGLALVGTSATIGPLLEAMHNDPAAAVRERAACSLAESGMLSHQQRLRAVPQLIEDSEDGGLDAQTRAWAFEALGEITGERLPSQSAAWREWYQRNRGE
jgi:HEAT repeat protein